MQFGVSYTPGQLLAVVASRTVLVVDAPTDWSLAGPLWELALDDAPVDEILDVLVRRGIRTSPSFAIVRVEGEAVRALVRGSVPVCFERTGEPVRLDATGATTWLEGLISGATRVLVGDVDQKSELPYLVHTGVVLVGGLALPCGASSRPQPGDAAPVVSEAPLAAEAAESPAEPVAETSAEPVRTEGDDDRPAAGGRPPRVVDLTRSAPRTGRHPVISRSGTPGAPAVPVTGPAAEPAPPVPARPASDVEERPAAARAADPFSPPDDLEVHHAPTVVPAADQAPASEPVVESFFETSPEPAADVAAPVEAPTVEPEPVAEPVEAATVEPEPVAEPVEHAFEASPFDETGRDETLLLQPVDRATEAGPAPEEFTTEDFGRRAPWSLPDGAAAAWGLADLTGPSAPQRPSDPGFGASMDSGEVPFADVIRGSGQPEEPAAPAEAAPGVRYTDPFAAGAPPEAPVESPVEAPAASTVDEDDLLVDGEPARGPLPTALPNFDPPSVSLKLPSVQSRRGLEGLKDAATGVRGHRAQPEAQPRPPLAEPVRTPQVEAWAEPQPEPESRPELQPEPQGEPAGSGAQASSPVAPDAPDHLEQPAQFAPAEAGSPAVDPAGERVEESFEDYVRSRALELSDEDEPGSLPFRVRGQTLRPEHRVPFGGLRGNNGAWPRAGESSQSPFIPAPSGGINGVNGVNGVNGKNGHGHDEPEAPVEGPGGPPDDGAESDGLLLPAFFRGARAARSKTADPAVPDHPAPVWARGGAAERPQHERQSGPPGLRGTGSPGVGSPIVPPGGVGGGAFARAKNGHGEGPGDGGPFDGPGDEATSVFLPQNEAPGQNVPPREPPRLLGVWCDAGHVTSPDQPDCRVCGLRVPPQAPILVARPPLGVLIFDNGDRVEVDRPVILGRDPKPVPSPDPETPVMHAVPSATGQVSRTHAEVRASGWDVVITDLDAMNGTTLTTPGGSPVTIEPGVPLVITSGSRVDLGGECGFGFEVEG